MLDNSQNLDDACTPRGPQPPMQRMVGRAHVGLVRRLNRAALSDLHQSGSAKVFLPRVYSDEPEVVFLNTAGGITGGDDLKFGLSVGEGVRAMATTQTAERAYRSTGDTGHVDISIEVAAGGSLAWLPQETILFDKSSLARKTGVQLADDARFLMAESVVLGRAAMGETIDTLAFSDWREVRRAGKPVWVDPFALDAKVLEDRGNSVTLAGARALATVALIEQGAEDAAEGLRRVVETFDAVEAAVSGWNGKCIVRLRAPDAWPLRRAVAQILKTARGGNLPRVWQE